MQNIRKIQGFKDGLKKAFLTVFFSGLIPKMPGTFGTLFALPFAWIILYFFSPTTLFLSAILVSAIAIKMIDSYEQIGMSHDCKEIVIDELAGVWITLSMACMQGVSVVAFLLSFLFFRIFDIWKPSIIGKVDRETKGGLGVVGDDLLAGVFAGIAVWCILKGLILFEIAIF